MKKKDTPVVSHDEGELLSSIGASAVVLTESMPYARLHSDRAVCYALALGKRCGLAETDLKRLMVGARFRDMGKIAIPERILYKKGKLSAGEYEIVKTHSVKSETIVRDLDVDGVDAVAVMVRHHHENFDGTGYPDGLGGESIPVGARIIAIVDAYDAMMSYRSYRPAMSAFAARAQVEAESGSHFDPYVARKFMSLLRNAAR